MEVGNPRKVRLNLLRWGNLPVHIISYDYSHPIYHVNVIKLTWEIVCMRYHT